MGETPHREQTGSLESWAENLSSLMPLAAPAAVAGEEGRRTPGPGVLGEAAWGRWGGPRLPQGVTLASCHSTSGCPCSPGTKSPDGFT